MHIAIDDLEVWHAPKRRSPSWPDLTEELVMVNNALTEKRSARLRRPEPRTARGPSRR